MTSRFVTIRVDPIQWSMFQEGALVMLGDEYFRVQAVNQEERIVVLAEHAASIEESSEYELTPNGFVLKRP